MAGQLADSQRALLQQFPAGVVLIQEGSPADFLHVPVDGIVEIFADQMGPNGASPCCARSPPSSSPPW